MKYTIELLEKQLTDPDVNHEDSEHDRLDIYEEWHKGFKKELPKEFISQHFLDSEEKYCSLCSLMKKIFGKKMKGKKNTYSDKYKPDLKSFKVILEKDEK